MEITIKISRPKLSKKQIISFLVVPVFLVITAIYLYFFWGKPLDVSPKIWLEGKKFYEIRIENKEITQRERRTWSKETSIFLIEHKSANQSNYSTNEENIILGMDYVFNDWGYCVEEEIHYLNEKKCQNYKDGLEMLAHYYE